VEQELRRRLILLQQLSDTLGSIYDLPELLRTVLERVFEIIPAERGVILLLNEATSELESEAVKLKDAKDPEETPAEIQLSHSIIDRVVQEHEALLLMDAQSDVEFGRQASVVALGIRSAMCVPLLYREQLLGVIHLDTANLRHVFQRDHLELLTAIANLTAMRIHDARVMREIERANRQRNNMRRYFSPQFVDKLMAQEAEVEVTVGDRLEVAVLESDIRGFTAMSESMEPQEIVEMLNDYLSEMTKIIFKHDGMIDKYIGDAILAVFGSPFRDPQRAAKAVAAAVDMQNALETWNERRAVRGKKPVYMGIGINGGPVVHGNIGSPQRMEFTVIGDTVNTAARLCDRAAPGEILVSSPIYEGANDFFDFEVLDPMEFKGKAEPLPVYRVLGYQETEAVAAQMGEWMRYMRAVGESDLGRVREENEDKMHLDERNGIFIVADGLGGRRGGETGSRMAVETIYGHLLQYLGTEEEDKIDLAKILEKAMQRANAEVLAAARTRPELEGMGATGSVVVVRDHCAFISSIGDSRVYLLREEGIEQLTEDDTVTWQLLKRGLITRDQARRHQMRSMLTNCLGKAPNLQPRIHENPLQRGDYLLLCSDGLWEPVSDQEIANIVHAAETPSSACRRLIERANDRGGKDNVTVILISIEK
jgi:adenylate cyclase